MTNDIHRGLKNGINRFPGEVSIRKFRGRKNQEQL
jgi:hypothetical protein